MKKGFTLIELLVVIAIIAILAAMLMPALSKARVEARKTACLSQEHHVGLGCHMYLNAKKDRWPGFSHEDGPEFTSGEALGGLYPTYVPSVVMFSCPGNAMLVTEVDDELVDAGYTFDAATDTTNDGDTDFGVPLAADPMRAVMLDSETNHHGLPEGACVLFVDNHAEFVLGVDVIPNPYLEEDADIYSDDGELEILDADCP